MFDFVLYDTFSGGSKFFYSKDRDIQTARSLFIYVYVLVFGGNVEALTTGSELPRQKRHDYWGNACFYQNNPEKWINSEFEKALNEIELSSSGRVKLEDALKRDLKRLETFGEVIASVKIAAADKVIAEISLENVGKFTLTWNANLKENIIATDDGINKIETGPTPTEVTYHFSPTGDYCFSGDLQPYKFSQ